VRIRAPVLLSIQQHFHALIRARSAELMGQATDVDLPVLARFPIEGDPAWLPVPGMYGGFSYWFVETGDQVKLISESWSRVQSGSGQHHEITASGSQLIEEGFV
jgi:hypothetical protein